MNESNKSLLNRELNDLETRERKIVLESMPLRLMAVLTTVCNLECIMCPRVRANPSSTLSFELIKKTFTLFPYLERIEWQGGEVFLLDYFKEVFLKAAGYPYMAQYIVTNGLLIDEEWAEIFSRSKVFLVYSIDAVKKTTYESIRSNARFEDLLRSLDLVNKANTRRNGGINLELHAVVMKRNYRELFLFPDFCKRHNFRMLVFDLLCPDIVPEEDIFLKPDKGTIEHLKQEIAEIRDRCREYNIFFHCTFDRYLRDFCRNTGCTSDRNRDPSNADDGKSHINHNCFFPWTDLHLNADGLVYPECKCTRSIGDLRKNSLEEIWNGETMQLYRTLLKNKGWDKICSEQCKLYASLNREET